MADSNQVDKQDFLYRYYKYLGQVKPENLVFNANLQEFAQRVSFICNLETGGKLSPQESYQQIESLWQQLTQSYKVLKVGEDSTLDEGITD